MQIHAVIDDNLYQQAIQASGLPDTQAMLEEALRVLIASKSPHQDEDFFALAGLWEGRDIDLNQLRGEAWPERRE